jgi:hypothetical protein
MGVSKDEGPGVTVCRSWLLILGLCLVFPWPARAQNTHLLVITGVGGDPAHTKKFEELATRFIAAAKKTNGVVDANLTYLADKAATRVNIEKAVDDIAARARPNDQVVVLLFGHGSSPDPRSGAFNIMGPDLTADDYAKLLSKLATQQVVFVNTASASGAFLPALSGKGRIIVTATRNGRENIETRFPKFFVAAYEDAAADRDRNGRVSVLEAFDYAKAMVAKEFEQEGHLATEHATIDDGSDGTLASTVFLASGAVQAASTYDTSNPEVKQLLEARDALEREVAGLRLRKDGMSADEYDAQLEKLLIELAMKSQALQKFEGKK